MTVSFSSLKSMRVCSPRCDHVTISSSQNRHKSRSSIWTLTLIWLTLASKSASKNSFMIFMNVKRRISGAVNRWILNYDPGFRVHNRKWERKFHFKSQFPEAKILRGSKWIIFGGESGEFERRIWNRLGRQLPPAAGHFGQLNDRVFRFISFRKRISEHSWTT